MIAFCFCVVCLIAIVILKAEAVALHDENRRLRMLVIDQRRQIDNAVDMLTDSGRDYADLVIELRRLRAQGHQPGRN